jgi:VanZ family protein
MMAIALTILLSTLPNFHPETYLGLSYTWQLDMLIHGGYYFLLTLLLRYFVFKQSSIFFFVNALFFFSVVLELLQLWIPKRSLTLLDLLSNFIGIISGVIFLYFVQPTKIKN